MNICGLLDLLKVMAVFTQTQKRLWFKLTQAEASVLFEKRIE